ncbi:hypothetical protein BV898_06555 [Hypsibius exemplaris]|uniref:Uncharacterized protein n=1 Tax=Hypsibius exemplaris TaxID=2072580 RepID=A0A1W0WW47_HYPEX|nr:hypothetical protein BV898_06555 [Hypsibius exemplaris]
MDDLLNDILETEVISEFFQSFNGKPISSPETPFYNMGNLEISIVQEFLQLLAYILSDHCEHYKPYYKDEKEKMVPGYLLKPENNPEVFKVKQHAANSLDQRKAETALAIGSSQNKQASRCRLEHPPACVNQLKEEGVKPVLMPLASVRDLGLENVFIVTDHLLSSDMNNREAGIVVLEILLALPNYAWSGIIANIK